jgi:hypothetical protein
VRGTPIPSGRAVLRAERLVPPGSLERGDTALYHIVTDQFVFAFLPMVGRLVPRLAIAPRDVDGGPLENLDDAVVHRQGEELKVWQAVLDYAAAQPRGEDGEPWIRADYAAPEGRLVEVRAAPLWLWPAAASARIRATAAPRRVPLSARPRGPIRHCLLEMLAGAPAWPDPALSAGSVGGIWCAAIRHCPREVWGGDRCAPFRIVRGE